MLLFMSGRISFSSLATGESNKMYDGLFSADFGSGITGTVFQLIGMTYVPSDKVIVVIRYDCPLSPSCSSIIGAMPSGQCFFFHFRMFDSRIKVC